jgi:hypothetical protein
MKRFHPLKSIFALFSSIGPKLDLLHRGGFNISYICRGVRYYKHSPQKDLNHIGRDKNVNSPFWKELETIFVDFLTFVVIFYTQKECRQPVVHEKGAQWITSYSIDRKPWPHQKLMKSSREPMKSMEKINRITSYSIDTRATQ